ncbi:MAG TPA: protein kinase [Kofleriaceae bacterium]|nr:protein kinase [Kofleriaceae bacterium]
MTPTREDLELYVTGNYDGDVAALERAIADDPALAAIVAEEARLDMLLRDAAASATFCVACNALVRNERCDDCGAAVKPGGYTVERVLVSNAHGRMYVAYDADGKRVALKELAFVHAPSASAIAAFEREAKFLRALEHPAIPRFCASFEEGKGVHTRYYLAQELVEGKALDQLDEHWYTEAEIIDIAKQVLAILVYLQSLSPMVIHRDIKPANLLRRTDGSIALVDFGAAYVQGATAGFTTIGTFGYMPIEQLAGIVDATTDCYALGATLLNLLTREEPWRLAQTKTNVNASAPLRAFLDKLIATEPRERFPSAKDALAALDKRDALVVAKPLPRARARKWPIVGAAVAAVAIGGGIAAFSLSSSEPQVMVKPTVVADGFGHVRIRLVGGAGVAKGLIDGKVMVVKNNQLFELSAGSHRISIIASADTRCEQDIVVKDGETMTLECNLPDVEVELAPLRDMPKLKADKIISWEFKDVPLQDVLMLAGATCNVNIVVPDYIRGRVTVDLDKVQCDQAIESILEAQGLWYSYSPVGNLMRVAPRKDLDEEARAPARANAATLPPGKTIDINIKDADLHDALKVITLGSGVNLVIPDYIRGKLTVRFKNVPWEQAFEAALASQGLWYRYRENGHIITVAPRKDIEAEDAAHGKRP